MNRNILYISTTQNIIAFQIISEWDFVLVKMIGSNVANDLIPLLINDKIVKTRITTFTWMFGEHLIELSTQHWSQILIGILVELNNAAASLAFLQQNILEEHFNIRTYMIKKKNVSKKNLQIALSSLINISHMNIGLISRFSCSMSKKMHTAIT